VSARGFENTVGSPSGVGWSFVCLGILCSPGAQDGQFCRSHNEFSCSFISVLFTVLEECLYSAASV